MEGDPKVDYARLRKILDSPAAATLPPALRTRMEADVKAHELATATPALAPRDDVSAQPVGPTAPAQIAPPSFAPVDASVVDNPFRAAQRHELAKQVAKQQTQGLVNTMATVAMQPAMLAMQFGHDMTFGLAPSPYGEHADPEVMDEITRKAQIPIRIVSGIGTALLQGYGLMKGLSFVGKVPIASRALEFIPTRLKEIGLGAIINGGLDVLRADGLQRDAQGNVIDSWLDPSTKVAKPLAEMGVPDRIALGLGGAAVGGILGGAFMGIASGHNAARARVVSALPEQTQVAVREGLASVGITPGTLADKYQTAQTFIKNLRKIALNEDLSGVMADQLSREQFIANELREGSANFASPDLQYTRINLPAGQVTLSPVAQAQPMLDAINKATKRVGFEEFQRQVSLEMSTREASIEAQRQATEAVARRIMARPEGTKSAYDLLQEFQGTSFADTPAHKAALQYANQVSTEISLMTDLDVSKAALRDRMLRDQYIHPDGTFYVEKPTLPVKPARSVQPAGPVKPGKPINTPEDMSIEVRNKMGEVQQKMGEEAQVELDGRLMAGIFRNNPGGVNVVTNVRNDAAILAAQDRLGVKLAVAKVERMVPIAEENIVGVKSTRVMPQTDYLIGRPEYNYPSYEDQAVFGKLTNKMTAVLKKMATEAATSVRAPKTTEAFILHDGTPIRGGLNTSAMIEKMRLQKPVVAGQARGDLALQDAGQFIRMDIPETGKLVVDLPRNVSKEQFTALGKAIDTMRFDEVTVRTSTGKQRVFQSPIGAVVQDHIAEMIPPKSVGVSITPEMVRQYQREGVFAGQAVVLPDGSVGEMVGHAAGEIYKVKEHLTGQEVLVHGKSMTVLPSALSGELRGSNLFASYLNNSERTALATLRKSIASGWAKPIEKYRDFERFANTRGYMSEALRGGRIRLTKVNEGGAEPIIVKGLKAAVEWVRKDTAPMAELANDEVTKLLGPDRNIGFLGGGGPPPRMNELLPIDWKRMEATMESLPTNRGPGAIQTILKPMLPLMRDLDARFGTQMYKAAANMQSQALARVNFEALWYHGIGGELPNGIKPLAKIIKMAGRNANQELITDWREADAAGRAALAKSMTKQELEAAEELGRWYDEMYQAMGIGAPFVENYMPRYREAIQSGNPQSFQDFVASIAGDPMKVPKGTDWVSDHIRNGFIDTYNKEAFSVAVQYLRAGAKNRFMKTAQNEAREMVRMIADKNPNLALPLANMLQAMGGYEFAEQRAMLNETFKSLMDKLPSSMGASGKASLAEKLTDWTTSLVYASTMGFRPALALRNAKDIFVMSYPIYGGPKFMDAVGYALTREGREEAAAARVISNYGGGLLTSDTKEAIAKLPQWMQKTHEASTALYESADEFTRTGTYFAAKFKAQEALEDFARGIEKQGTKQAVVNKLKDKLARDSKIYLFGDQVKEEFFRRAAQDPEAAARYAGKVGADFTNFIYGRGMQARWMRSIGGRLMGQFGTWSMWYADYLGQLVKMAAKGENRADAMMILGRHALINAAIVETGRRVLDVDLSRWASYGALFYSGGPGLQIAMGASTLMRGMGDVTSLSQDPMAQQRVNSGAQMIWNTLPAFVPYHSAARDVGRMIEAYDPTELLAATLGTRVTRDYQTRRKVDILTGDFDPTSAPFQSTSPALGTMLNNAVTGQGQQPVDLRATGSVVTNLPEPAPAPAPTQGQSTFRGQAVKNRMPNTMPQTMETKPSAEPRPFGGY